MSEISRLLIGPYELRSAECRDNDPRAVMVARQIAEEIFLRLPGIRVEHVGSTAVPGCAGKGIVDLMIAVPEGKIVTVRGTIDELGFQKQPHADPFPEDRPMRVGSVDFDGETFLLHVHLIPADSPEAEEMRFFRACLRGDPELVRIYVAKKREIIAGGITDSQAYSIEKKKFIKELFG